MASLTASSGNAVVRNASKVTTNSISSLRVRPFTKLAQGRNSVVQQKPVFRLRAAEPEVEAEAAAAAPAEENEFEFSMSDAKKNNDYSPSDVEAALRFYNEGGAPPAFNDDFISNPFDEEDASFFDDIDNNEAYDADEYVVAGIPEAAPKKRGRGRRDGAGEDDEDDEISKGKQIAQRKAMEEQMVLEAAMEEEYGSEYDRASDGDAQMVATQGIWDWLTDTEATADASDDLSSSKLATMRHSRATLPSDYEVLSGFSTLKVDELDDQTRDMLELIIGDEVTEEELRTMDFNVDIAVPESDGLTQAEADNLDALAAKPVDALEIEAVGPVQATVFGEETELSRETLDSYLASLKGAAEAGSDMSEDEVKALFDGEPVEVDDAAEPADDAEVAAILAAADPQVPASEELDLTEADSLLITADEEADYEVKDIKQELRTLAALDDFTADDMPDEQQLAILDQYLSSAEEFLKAEDERKISAQQMVLDGELSADVFAEDLEELPDMERDYAEDFQEAVAMDDDEDNLDMLYDQEDDSNENWVERIIELNRVTKVVKGGKIMGFRCTAIVGNQNGLVGVGCQAGREVAVAAKRALVDAKRNVVRVPLVGAGTIPHKSEAKYHAARCVIVPASDGTGVIAGGSIKAVLELAGVQNVLAKRIGCRSALNNARATIKALQQLKSLNEVAKARGVPMDHLLLPQDA